MAVVPRLKAKTTSKKRIKLNQSRIVKYDVNYFTLPKPFWMVAMVAGIGFLVTLTLSPGSIPSFLGPVATYGRYIKATYPNQCIYLCAFILIVHTLQAAYAGKVCHDRGMTTSATIKWVLSTFLFGFSSLILRLLPQKPAAKTS